MNRRNIAGCKVLEKTAIDGCSLKQRSLKRNYEEDRGSIWAVDVMMAITYNW